MAESDWHVRFGPEADITFRFLRKVFAVFALAVACPPRMNVRTRPPVSESLSVYRLEFFPTGFAEVA
jgi:hypothetical protein